MNVNDLKELRHEMIEHQLKRRGIKDRAVLDAMMRIPRHIFVPDDRLEEAYEDHPLPIGNGQTISQPYIVAMMTELLKIDSSSRVLEIGAGCGYQTAILADIAGMVFSLEFLCSLAEEAQNRVKNLGYGNVLVKCGNGWQGWDRAAPFDAILVAAAPHRIPPRLVEQLAPGGRMVIPVGSSYQELKLVEKSKGGQISIRDIIPVRFVPMVGDFEGSNDDDREPPHGGEIKACG